MTPEDKARQAIDAQLAACGWLVQDYRDLDLSAESGIAVREFPLATGEADSVRELAEAVFSHVDLDWKQYVKHDPRYERPAEVDLLVGDASKAKRILGWEPKVRFHDLVRIMVDADMELLSREASRQHLGKLP